MVEKIKNNQKYKVIHSEINKRMDKDIFTRKELKSFIISLHESYDEDCPMTNDYFILWLTENKVDIEEVE